LGWFVDPPAEKSKERLFVPREQLAERFGGTATEREHQLLVVVGGYRLLCFGISGAHRSQRLA
jgi:hypothetical protein